MKYNTQIKSRIVFNAASVGMVKIESLSNTEIKSMECPSFANSIPLENYRSSGSICERLSAVDIRNKTINK